MAQAPFITARVVSLSRPDQRRIRVQEVDRLLATMARQLATVADRVDGLELDYGEEIPAPEELRVLAIALNQIRGGLVQAVGLSS